MIKVKKGKTVRENGITLVVLVVTIIILLILAGISISALTNQGLFVRAQEAKKETQRAQITEWLNLKLMEERAFNPTGTAEQIIEATRHNVIKNQSELKKMGKDVNIEDTSCEEDGEQVDIYFYVIVDKDVYKVEILGAKFIGELGKFPLIGDITFTYTVDGQEIDKETWTNKNVTVTASTTVKGYTLQTSTDEKTWNATASQTFTENGTMYVALYDGKNFLGTVSENVTNIDTTVPDNATINLSSTSTNTSSSITATVTHNDSESGVEIANCKWVYNTESGEIGTNANSYTETFSSNSEEITLSTTTAETYYLHVLTTDIAGNVKETISEAITCVQETLTLINNKDQCTSVTRWLGNDGILCGKCV